MSDNAQFVGYMAILPLIWVNVLLKFLLTFTY